MLAKIPDGVYGWEDYAEHDGVDPPRLHAQRMTLTKDGDRLVIDFAGTDPQAKGPINHAGDYADGNFLKKWLAPILRNLADTPERMAELDVNEGVVELIEMRFPPPGTLLTPVFPAPTNARTFVILRLLGVFAGALAQAVDGRMPADQETIRYTGHHRPRRRRASGTCTARSSAAARAGATTPTAPTRSTSSRTRKNLPAEFVETRYPVRVEHLGAARRLRRRRASSAAASATARTSACSRTRRSCPSPTARSSPAGACAAGKAGLPFRVTIDPGGPNERVLPGLCDDEPIAGGRARPHRDDRRRRVGRSARPRAGAASRSTCCRARSPREAARDDVRRGARRRGRDRA